MVHSSVLKTRSALVAWESGYPEDCKSLYAGSSPAATSKLQPCRGSKNDKSLKLEAKGFNHSVGSTHALHVSYGRNKVVDDFWK